MANRRMFWALLFILLYGCGTAPYVQVRCLTVVNLDGTADREIELLEGEMGAIEKRKIKILSDFGQRRKELKLKDGRMVKIAQAKLQPQKPYTDYFENSSQMGLRNLVLVEKEEGFFINRYRYTERFFISHRYFGKLEKEWSNVKLSEDGRRQMSDHIHNGRIMPEKFTLPYVVELAHQHKLNVKEIVKEYTRLKEKRKTRRLWASYNAKQEFILHSNRPEKKMEALKVIDTNRDFNIVVKMRGEIIKGKRTNADAVVGNKAFLRSTSLKLSHSLITQNQLLDISSLMNYGWSQWSFGGIG